MKKPKQATLLLDLQQDLIKELKNKCSLKITIDKLFERFHVITRSVIKRFNIFDPSKVLTEACDI